ncbi:MAG: hypothetical protein CMP31_11570 [Roseibacillus sp.]|nr:hypothetical protein [Roseibacillus sp.]
MLDKVGINDGNQSNKWSHRNIKVVAVHLTNVHRASHLKRCLLSSIACGNGRTLPQLDGRRHFTLLDGLQIDPDEELTATGPILYLLKRLRRSRGRPLAEKSSAEGGVHPASHEEADDDGGSPDGIFIHFDKRSTSQ